MDPISDNMSLEALEDELVYTTYVYGTLDLESEDYEIQKKVLDDRIVELERRIATKKGSSTGENSGVAGANLANDDDEYDGNCYNTSFKGPDDTNDFTMFSNAESALGWTNGDYGHTSTGKNLNTSQFDDQHNRGNMKDATGYKKRYRLSHGLTCDTSSIYNSKRRRTGSSSSQSEASRSPSGSNTSEEGTALPLRIKHEQEQKGIGHQDESSASALQRVQAAQQRLEDIRRQEREDERLALELQGSQDLQVTQRPAASAMNPKRTIKDYAYGSLAPCSTVHDAGTNSGVKPENGIINDSSQSDGLYDFLKFEPELPSREMEISGPSSFTSVPRRILPWDDVSGNYTIGNNYSKIGQNDTEDDSLVEISPEAFQQFMSTHEPRPRPNKSKGTAVDDDQAHGLESLIIDLENEEGQSSMPGYGYSLPGTFPGPSGNYYTKNYMPYGNYQYGPGSGSWMSNSKDFVHNSWKGLSNPVNGLVEGFTDLSNLILNGNSYPTSFDGLPSYKSFMPDKSSGIIQGANGNIVGGNNFIDLDAPKHDYAYGDPQKTKEEINKLLENIRPDEDLTPERREGTPEAMRVTLMEHQKVGLTWLKNTESGSNQGGILADDMGLGKTIQAMALIVSRPSEDPRRKATLIVAPVSLMRQWDREIKSKLKPGRHKLSVYVHHGSTKKTSFSAMSDHDVVLTTFGTLASELKKKRVWEQFAKENPGAKQRPKDKLFLIGDECKWYRVIIDEAQCIKNKNTATAQAACLLQAKYRLCMTGTPMMNNVTELYSLIHFLRIKPYCDWYKFNNDIGRPLSPSGNEAAASRAMSKLQALLKAICLRRSKFSKMDGKPILEGLPPRATHERNTTFSQDERDFYRAVESKTQLQFNKYLRAGTVGRNYTTILVLLLRLRQACCHPFLLKDFGVKAADLASTNTENMADLARRLEADVVNRIKAAEGAFECPICLDAVESPAIFFPCGHDTCSECFARLADPSRAIAEGQFDGNATKCPECRQQIDPKNVIDYSIFKKIYIDGDDLEADKEEKNKGPIMQGGDHEDTDSSQAEESDNSTESDSDVYGTSSTSQRKRKGKEREGEGFSNRDAISATTSKMRTMADEKAKGGRSAEAKRKYRRRLRRNWQSSAKVDEAMSVIKDVLAGDETEKILIFSQFTSLLDLMEVPIEQEGFVYRRYDGSMNANARNESILDFTEQRDVRIMLISLKAGNAGLNLNAASQVIMLDPFWNPYVEEQAIDRAHRIGQTRMVNVHRMLVKDTVEDRILALQEKKRKLISTALDEEAGQSVSRLGTRELAYLFGVAPNQNPNTNTQM